MILPRSHDLRVIRLSLSEMAVAIHSGNTVREQARPSSSDFTVTQRSFAARRCVPPMLSPMSALATCLAWRTGASSRVLLGDDEDCRLEQGLDVGIDLLVADGFGHERTRAGDLADMAGAQGTRGERCTDRGEVVVKCLCVGECEVHRPTGDMTGGGELRDHGAVNRVAVERAR